MRSPIRCLGILLALCFVIGSVAMADDIYPPSWRGDSGTTYQQWIFLTGANLAAPDQVDNPYGDPTATMIVGDMGVGWIDVDQFGTYGSRTGLWDLGSAGTIDLDIPNRPGGGAYKDIWVQVTYFVGMFDAPEVSIAGAQQLEGWDSRVVEQVDDFDAWHCAVSKWRITPNPDSEVVRITASGLGSVIDQVVVDTKCVPEPSCIVSLLAGAMGLLISRRRRK
jgi:hypothetical protein